MAIISIIVHENSMIEFNKKYFKIKRDNKNLDETTKKPGET
jgi:hypothetical protein